MIKKISITFVFSILLLGVSFLNQILISNRFGTSRELDGYWLALSIAGVLNFFSHPLRDSVIPVFSGLLVSKKDASDYIGSTISLALILGLLGWGLIVVYYFTVPQFLNVTSREKLNPIVDMLFWLGPSIALLATTELLIGVLTALNLVIPQAFCRTFSPLASCFTLFFLGDIFGIYAMPIAAFVASVMTIAVVFIFLKKAGIALLFHNPLKTLSNKNRGMFLSLSLIYIVAQLNVFIERYVFSMAAEGTISSYQYAIALVGTLIGLISGPISAVLWPKFLELSLLRDKESIWKILENLLLYMVVPLVFVCIFLFKNSSPVVYIMFSRGGFTERSLLMTSMAFGLLIFTTIPACMHQIVGRLLNSQRDSRSILISSMAIATTSITILICGGIIGNYTIAMSHWFIANSVGAILSLFLARSSNEGSSFNLKTDSVLYIKVAAFALVSYLICPVFLLEAYKPFLFGKLLIGFICYFIICVFCFFWIFRRTIILQIANNFRKQ